MFRELIQDCQLGVPTGVMAWKFHRGLAQGVIEICCRQDLPVVLTGGVFQNRILTEMIYEELTRREIQVGLHHQVPPNDGGLAVGSIGNWHGKSSSASLNKR